MDWLLNVSANAVGGVVTVAFVALAAWLWRKYNLWAGVVALVVGIIIVSGVFIYRFGESKGQQEARAELQPTIMALQTSVASSALQSQPSPSPTTPTLTYTHSASKVSEIRYVNVDSTVYPFKSTNITLNPGDTVEFSVEGGAASTWQCAGSVFLSADGLYDVDRQKSVFYTPANFCSLIGYIEGNLQDRQFFQVGTASKISVEVQGILYLGVNDTPPQKCPLDIPENCYRDNTGAMSVKIQVTRKV
jgi:hypothetical protein